MSPNVLGEGLSSLFARYSNEAGFLEPLLVEAARNPALYFDACYRMIYTRTYQHSPLPFEQLRDISFKALRVKRQS